MTTARAHAEAHGASVAPVLSPEEALLLGDHPALDVAELRHAGLRVVPWTTNDRATMRTLIRLRVDGLISDRPDILQDVLKEEAAANTDAAWLAAFEVVGHRGARGLRPENTLPAFEAGLDHLVAALETDTGITADRVSVICHNQFFDPRCCRHTDGSVYTLEDRSFICDKLRSAAFPDQTNDVALSPVAAAFAACEGLINLYVPTYVEQLFRFTRFYADYYSNGPGRSHQGAAARAANAAMVRFNIETKILPLPNDPEGISVAELPLPDDAEPTTNHTVDPQTFVTTLCGEIARNQMEDRVRILSFDFRILQLVEEQFPKVCTYYLVEGS
jgi:glycerophosphoryl diester phosphodiesterase